MLADRTLAFLGTGLMGAPMAARLIHAGYEVRLWNRSPEKMQPLEALGGKACATPSQAVAGAALVCVCLTDAAAVEQVLFGAHAATERMGRGTVLMDFSTIGVGRTRDFAARAATHWGIDWLDCPVSGGVTGARKGSLIILAGGDPEPIGRAMPVLMKLASRVTRMGAVGAGQAAKLCNQLIVAANLVAIAEAIALGESLGLDASQLPMALQEGFADSKPLQIFGPRMAKKSSADAKLSQIQTMYKDVELIAGNAADGALELPLLQTIERLYANLVAGGCGDDDMQAIMKLYRTCGHNPS